MSISLISAVWERSRAKGLGLLVLIRIADNIPGNNIGYCPSLKVIAKDCRIDFELAKVLIAQLENQGEILPAHAPDYKSCVAPDEVPPFQRDHPVFALKFPISLAVGFNEDTTFSPRPTEEKKPESQAGYVYLLHGNGYYKIGLTKYLDQRVKQLSPKLPFPIDLIHAIRTDNMYWLESHLHNLFSDKHTNGEWFALDEEEIRWLMTCVRWDKDQPRVERT